MLSNNYYRKLFLSQIRRKKIKPKLDDYLLYYLSESINMRLFIILFSMAFVISSLNAQIVNIIPQPQSVEWGEGSFAVNKKISITYPARLETSALILQKEIFENLGFTPEITTSPVLAGPAIRLQLNEKLGEEAYELMVGNKEILVTGSGETGLFYAIQSLMQLINAHEIEEGGTAVLPQFVIKDEPRFQWRAFMLDESRYFKGMEQVKMILDEMAYLKMNVFHWHLVDDQGWRIEIKKYPLLTEIGSKRKSTQVGPLKWGSPIQSGEPHAGFYTQEEIKEVVAYAKARHITVVPEIEMPGHSSAAIASYSWLGTNKEEIEVPINFGVGQDVYDVSDPQVITFLTDVLDEVISLFPSKVIHIGGDEVKYEHWKSSPEVNAYMKEKGLDTPAELQVYFTNSISQYLESKGRRMMGWNEIMGHNLHEYQDEADTQSDVELAKSTVIHFWKGDVELATQAASNGYEIVNSLHSETYLDYNYEDIPLSRSYAFDPIPADLDAQYHDKVIGTGCQMWGEWIPTNGYMHFQTFPRIAAYAEVGWTQMEQKNYEDFKTKLPHLQKRWTAKEIYFAPDRVVEPE